MAASGTCRDCWMAWPAAPIELTRPSRTTATVSTPIVAHRGGSGGAYAPVRAGGAALRTARTDSSLRSARALLPSAGHAGRPERPDGGRLEQTAPHLRLDAGHDHPGREVPQQHQDRAAPLLHARDPVDLAADQVHPLLAAALVRAQHGLRVCGRVVEAVTEDHGVLYGLARALAEHRGHGVPRVAHERDQALAPAVPVAGVQVHADDPGRIGLGHVPPGRALHVPDRPHDAALPG